MIDHTAAQLALRNRAIGLSVCTTGSTSLSATNGGYARAAGSFVTDGFADGMEIIGTGFSLQENNEPGVITRVEATALTIKGGRKTEAAASGKTLAVGLPAVRAWENLHLRDGSDVIETPVAGRPFIEEDYIPATTVQLSGPYSGGTMQQDGLYVIRWHGLTNTGTSGIRKCVDDLVALFTPGTSLTAGSHTVRVRGDIGPDVTRIEPLGNGWSVVTVTIYWRAYSTNAIAA